MSVVKFVLLYQEDARLETAEPINSFSGFPHGGRDDLDLAHFEFPSPIGRVGNFWPGIAKAVLIGVLIFGGPAVWVQTLGCQMS